MKGFLLHLRDFIKQEKVLFGIGVLSPMLMIAGGVLLSVTVSDFSLPVILHFDRMQGIDLFGTRGDVWGIWIGALCIVILNLILAKLFFYRERVLAYIFVVANVFFSIFVFIALAWISYVN